MLPRLALLELASLDDSTLEVCSLLEDSALLDASSLLDEASLLSLETLESATELEEKTELDKTLDELLTSALLIELLDKVDDELVLVGELPPPPPQALNHSTIRLRDNNCLDIGLFSC